MHILTAVHQSVLTLEDNSEDDDLLDLTDSRAKNKRRRRCQTRKLRCLHDKMLEVAADFKVKLSIKDSITKVASIGAKDCSVQKTYADIQFSGNSSLNCLIEDLKVESLARKGWNDLLNVTTKTGKVMSILELLTVISENDMKNARLFRALAEFNDSKNMCVVTWCSITSKTKRSMARHVTNRITPIMDQASFIT